MKPSPIKFTAVLLLLLSLGFALWLIRPDSPGRAARSVDSTSSSANLGGRTTEELATQAEPPLPFSMTPLDAEGNRKELRFVVKDFSREKTGDGDILVLPYQMGHVAPGAPDLPPMTASFEGKAGFRAAIKVVEGEPVSLGRMAIAPRPLRTARVNDDGKITGFDESRITDPAIYGKDAWYPSSLFQVEEAYAGTRRLTRIQYSPFQYNPVTGEVRHYPELVAQLEYYPETDETVAVEAQLSSTASGLGWSSDETGDCGCSERVVRAEDYLPAMNGQAADFAHRRSGAEIGACTKISVYQTGLHKLTRGALVTAGVDPSLLVGSDIRVYNQGQQVGVYVSRQGLFTASDYVLFYGERFHGYYSRENAYWLGFAPGQNQMPVRDGTPLEGIPLQVAGCMQQTVSDDRTYFPASNSPAPEYNGWYLGLGLKVTGFASGPEVTINNTRAALASGAVSLAIHAKARSVIGPNHHFLVKNTDTSISGISTSFSWPGTDYQTLTRTFLVADEFDAADNSQTFEFYPNPANVNDLIWLDEARFSFPRWLQTIDRVLAFGSSSGPANYRVTAISGGGTPWVLDVTDPHTPVLINNGTLSAGANGTQILQFGDQPAYDPCYLVTSHDRLINVAAADISIETFRDLGDTTRRVDYLMIVANPFEAAAVNLLAHRSAQGHRVLMVGLDEVMNEFGYGVYDVRSIKQMLGYAFHHWQVAPRFVTLVGDATYDPQKTKITQTDYIPTPLGATTFIYTALDAWYTTVNGSDNVPDVAIGRLPVNNTTQLNRIINKIISYEGAIATSPAWASKATFVADNEFVGNESGAGATPIIPSGFVTAVNNMATSICPFPAANVTKAYLNNGGQNQSGNVNAAAVRSTILSKVNAGTYVLHFSGHGASTEWADEDVFNLSDVNGSMNNSVWPLVAVFTCNNGVFHEPDGGNCMLEQMLIKNLTGSIAAVGPTGLAFSELSTIMANEYYEALLNDLQVVSVIPGVEPIFTRTTVPTTTIGEALLNGLTALAMAQGDTPAELKFYMIFGDPALKIKP